MTEVMIDIETLDTTRSSIVLSIGIQSFAGNVLGPGRLFLPSFDDQVAKGRTVSLSTLKFWASGQPPEAVEEAFQPESVRVHLSQMYNCVMGFLRNEVPEWSDRTPVWANGDLFDLGIVVDLFAGWPVPWYYNSPRDLRSVMREASSRGWAMPDQFEASSMVCNPNNQPMVAHTALGDCAYQIACLHSVRSFYDQVRT